MFFRLLCVVIVLVVLCWVVRILMECLICVIVWCWLGLVISVVRWCIVIGVLIVVLC